VVRHLFLGVVAVLLAAVGCNVSTPETSRLEATLSQLSLDHPTADLDKNVRGGDKRFIGVNGFVCGAPGLSGDSNRLIGRYGIHCLEGTSDVVEGSRHKELILQATRYAEAYNTELLRRIRSGLVP
jgi:hypothetical protein